MKNRVGERIRRIRASKGLKLANVAYELDMSTGAYAKIERGETDAPTSRLLQIAKILDVNVSTFFEDPVVEENKTSDYGYASKADVENLSHLVHSLIKEVEKLRGEIHRPPTKKRTKNSK